MTPAPPGSPTDLFRPTVFTRGDLVDSGMTRRQMEVAVREGSLVRLRRDRYARPATAPEVLHAARIGGRVTCLSLLRMLGVFVLKVDSVHVHLERNRSRLRGNERGSRIHWGAASSSSLAHVTLVTEAVRLSVRCQDPRASLATLDSALHQGFVTLEELHAVFAGLPARFHVLLGLVDGSAESGPETFLRLILRAMGVDFETQVTIPGVGRVDFLVEGWLIIERDSRAFHEGWDKQVADRNRDVAAARAGFVTVRPLASDLIHRPERIRAALQDILESLRPAGRPQLRKNARQRARSACFPDARDARS